MTKPTTNPIQKPKQEKHDLKSLNIDLPNLKAESRVQKTHQES